MIACIPAFGCICPVKHQCLDWSTGDNHGRVQQAFFSMAFYLNRILGIYSTSWWLSICAHMYKKKLFSHPRQQLEHFCVGQYDHMLFSLSRAPRRSSVKDSATLPLTWWGSSMRRGYFQQSPTASTMNGYITMRRFLYLKTHCKTLQHFVFAHLSLFSLCMSMYVH